MSRQFVPAIKVLTAHRPKVTSIIREVGGLSHEGLSRFLKIRWPSLRNGSTLRLIGRVWGLRYEVSLSARRNQTSTRGVYLFFESREPGAFVRNQREEEDPFSRWHIRSHRFTLNAQERCSLIWRTSGHRAACLCRERSERPQFDAGKRLNAVSPGSRGARSRHD